MDYIQHIEELLLAKMNRREPISPVIFVSSDVLNDIHNKLMQSLRYTTNGTFPNYSRELLLNTNLGQFRIMVNKDYPPAHVTNDGRTLADILVEDILLGNGEIE